MGKDWQGDPPRPRTRTPPWWPRRALSWQATPCTWSSPQMGRGEKGMGQGSWPNQPHTSQPQAFGFQLFTFGEPAVWDTALQFLANPQSLNQTQGFFGVSFLNSAPCAA